MEMVNNSTVYVDGKPEIQVSVLVGLGGSSFGHSCANTLL